MAAKKNKFSEFMPQGIGATPAQPQIPAPAPAPAPATAGPTQAPPEPPSVVAEPRPAVAPPSANVQQLLREKVPESLRLPIAAREQVRQLREKTRLSKDAVYLEALNMLFQKHGMARI